MPRRHRDNSTRLNLERNLRASGRYAPNDDYSLYRRDLDRQDGRDTRPIVDRDLERDADRASRIHLRHSQSETQFLEGYGGHYGKGPKGYQRSDERIKDEACEALYHSFEVDASEIEVEVKDAVVFLKGEVADRQTKRLAEDAVDSIRGIVDVRNELTVRRREPKINRNMSKSEKELGTRLS